MMKISRMSDILAEIKQRPSMYLGRLDLDALHMFLAGYNAALVKHGIDSGESPPGEFGRFIERRYGWPMDSGPFDAILANSASREEAWERFWRILEEFQKSQKSADEP